MYMSNIDDSIQMEKPCFYSFEPFKQTRHILQYLNKYESNRSNGHHFLPFDTHFKWSNDIMLCIIPCAGVSQMDQIDQMDTIFFHSNCIDRMAKWYHQVHNVNVASQMDQFSPLK